MFVRIYSGILFSTLISITCCYLAYQYINHVRASEYTLSIFSGTQQLITEGVNRHQDTKRKQWIDLVEKLIGLPISVSKANNTPLSHSQLEKLIHDKILIEPLKDGVHSRIWTQANDGKLISVKLKNIAEQQLRITAFLILNELGRYPRSKQFEQLVRLRQYFHYDINIYSKEQLNLDNQQLLRLDRGDVVVSFDKDKNNQDILQVYSRYKSTRQYLTIGPITTYNANPTWFMAALLVFALCVTGFFIYLLVKSLERRMKSISDVVVNFGPSTLGTRIDDSGQDAIAHMAKGINVMASRIENLLQDQKDITQAISHELRTPISRMKFRVEMLKEKADTTDLAKLEKLNHDIKELDLLVEELLVFQMLDSSKTPEPVDVDIVALIQTMISEIYEPYQDIELQLNFSKQAIWVKGDANQLRRMLQNLMINAFKHAQSKINVSLDTQPVTLQISDDGEGIPEDQRQRIFTPFVRLDSSRNRQTGGFGLGLAIISRIARLHQASIVVTKSSLGGANFKVTFQSSKHIEIKRRSP